MAEQVAVLVNRTLVEASRAELAGTLARIHELMVGR